MNNFTDREGAMKVDPFFDRNRRRNDSCLFGCLFFEGLQIRDIRVSICRHGKDVGTKLGSKDGNIVVLFPRKGTSPPSTMIR